MLYEQERDYKAYCRLDWIGLDRTGPDMYIGLDLCIGLDRLILLKCDTHSEQMVTIGVGKQVQSTGYDTCEHHLLLSR
jgi:hypothetical protein